MAIRRRKVATGQEDATQPEPSTGPGPHGTLTLRGSADDLKKQLGGGDEKPASEAKQDLDNGHDDENKKFVEALRNPKFIVRVKRMTPREFDGQKTNVEVWQTELPLGYQEIQEEVAKSFGGEKYRAAVIDPASNNTIAADTFVVSGDPKFAESGESQAEIDRMLLRDQPKTAAEITEDGLERRARVSARLLEVEALEGQLEDARKRRESGSKVIPQDNSRVDDLERRLTEAKHQAELENRDRKHAEDMRELKEMIAKNAQAKPTGAADPMMILMEQMREDRKQAQTQFTAILTQMKDDKLNAVLEEVKSIKSKPQGSSGTLLEQAQAMLTLKKLFGWGGDEDEDDDEGDENDDRPWWEKALDKLGGKLGDKLFAKFTAMEESGEKVDREKFMLEMSQHAAQVADTAVANVTKAKPAPVSTLPPPPPTATGPAAPATAPAPAIALPPPPPAAPAPQPAPEVLPKLSLQQEILLRVSGVLEMLHREMELRPNEYHWNYEGAFCSLPEEVLEKLCAAQDLVTGLDAFAIEHINPEMLGEMKAKITANPRIMAWVKIGHDELKGWYAEKQKDPTFDPFEGDEDEGEEA